MTRPAVWAERCGTCVFRPGNPMALGPGRLAELVAHNRAHGAALICHTTTHGQADREVVCRGWWDAYPDTPSIVVVQRLAAALGLDGDGFDHLPLPSDHSPTTTEET